MSRDLLTRIAQLLVGLTGVGLGIALMVDAHLGVSPWDMLHQGLHQHLGVGIGTVSIGLGLVVFLLWIPLLRTVRTVIEFVGVGRGLAARRRGRIPTPGRFVALPSGP